MIAELEPSDRLGEAGFRLGQSKAVVVGIDDLLVKSMAVFNHRMDAIDHRFGSIDRRIDVLENSMRFQMIGLIGIVVVILIGFASLFYAISK